jgi:hypothetical protein
VMETGKHSSLLQTTKITAVNSFILQVTGTD